MKSKVRLNRLHLNLSMDCNINCRRCYGHLEYGGQTRLMDLATAKQATELFLAQTESSGGQTPGIMFFGGEPLLNWPVIEAYLPWVRSVWAAKNPDLWLFTNGLALTEERIDYLLAHRTGLFVSLDGDLAQHQKARPITTDQFNHILDMIRYSVGRSAASVVPYCVVSREGLAGVEASLRFIASLGVGQLAVSKVFEEDWTEAERRSLFNILLAFRRTSGLTVFPFPEFVSDCLDCRPKTMMVYPDGRIYDLCQVCSTVLLRRGLADEADLEVMRLGRLGRTAGLEMDVAAKKALIQPRMTCPTLDRRPEVYGRLIFGP